MFRNKGKCKLPEPEEFRTATRFALGRLRRINSAGGCMGSDVREEGLVTRVAVRNGVSRDAVQTVLEALRRGGGTMAQFSHPDFGGMSQWAPGMVMVGDMFNTSLKSKLDAVATELASFLRESPVSPQTSGGAERLRGNAEPTQNQAGGWGQGWWPKELGAPSTSGAQNAMRYAFFPSTRRLAIEDNGKLTIYDTGEHRISGVSQAQSGTSSLSFTSQNGVVDLVQLKQIQGPSN
jgi:hypothetical protein